MNRTKLYVRLSEDDLSHLDTMVQTLNYQTRTEFTTALILSVIHGTDIQQTITKIRNSADTEFLMRDSFFLIIDEYAFPIIAMRGVDYTYRNLKEDLKSWMYQKCRQIPSDEEIYQWLHAYAAIKKSDIKAYRNRIILANYEEEHDIENTCEE